MRARLYIDDTRQRIRSGHPWVYDNQVLRSEGRPQSGGIVQVFDVKKGPLGQGFFNPKSKILARMLTKDLDEPIDAGFFRRKVQAAWDHRVRMGQPESCRVVFGEADGLPALVVDKFKDVLVLQTLALGMDRYKADIVAALHEVLAPRGIYERNDVPVREKEGLEQVTGYIGAEFDTDLIIEENGLRFAVDVAAGQKTGHFLDQRLNHAALEHVAQGARVLDCFTHTGGFALHAAKYGAAEVTGLDISEVAVGLANRNAALNGLEDRCTFKAANVFDFLSGPRNIGGHWDVIVLDPPAFAKSRSALDSAVRGYKEINLRAIKSLPPDGFLVTCSCSQHMVPELFRKTIADAAHDAHRELREVYSGGQPPDHPVHWSIPETHYLKCLVLQVL
ncbi:MAG: class I SAM-dependent rRNA methyltransferase [Flavobacteriales bacterium]|jgi:23S rRNA (cytosine1962-C5)-methyltransferase|nr:class I SAM-dependent rRNA methyltransferase [Flavobacteriales bacterium]MCB0759737.1 class I SAM-dependent rRNA methyltransferase [Flavobacteriales bacterium]